MFHWNFEILNHSSKEVHSKIFLQVVTTLQWRHMAIMVSQITDNLTVQHLAEANINENIKDRWISITKGH